MFQDAKTFETSILNIFYVVKSKVPVKNAFDQNSHINILNILNRLHQNRETNQLLTGRLGSASSRRFLLRF